MDVSLLEVWKVPLNSEISDPTKEGCNSTSHGNFGIGKIYSVIVPGTVVRNVGHLASPILAFRSSM